MTSKSDIAISVRNLSKSYSIVHNAARHSTLSEALIHRLKTPLQRVERETFWALKDVSFDIQKGDVVGIIGRNGAGKSTLLKILSRITEPTSGKVIMNGRVGSLLEVGTGFHPELTGRENIYMNGAILGMTKRDITKHFDAIVDFAGVEQFLDTPVKRYSSGMYVRLAFAVAAHLNPEILIVDEVLAVGDTEFQKKCLGKMQNVAQSGRTVLFVSHNLEAVRKLCIKSILLDSGRVGYCGMTREVLSAYLEGDEFSQQPNKLAPPTEADAIAYATRLTVENLHGKSVAEIPAGQGWKIRVEVDVVRQIKDAVVALGISTPMDYPFRTTWSQPRMLEAGRYEALFEADNILMAPGDYPLTIGLSRGKQVLHYIEKAGFLRISAVSDFQEDFFLVTLTDCGLILNPLKTSINLL